MSPPDGAGSVYLPIPYICGANIVTPNSSLSTMGVLEASSCLPAVRTHTQTVSNRDVSLWNLAVDVRTPYTAIGPPSVVTRSSPRRWRRYCVHTHVYVPLGWDMGPHSAHTQTERNTLIFYSTVPDALTLFLSLADS